MSYISVLYQIVFCPKRRNPCLRKENRDQLFAYMAGIIQHHKSHPYLINGVEDHLHILTHVHQTVAIANLVKEIKISSNQFIKQRGLFPDFVEWQVGYGAFSYSFNALDNLREYVRSQEEHHQKVDFKTELVGILEEHGVKYDERYLFE
jgi:putative transposase